MDRDAFEAQALRMWTSTRVPMTLTHLIAYTKAKRAEVEKHLDALVASGVMDMDPDEHGELHWSFHGCARSQLGPKTIGEVEALGRIHREIERVAPSAARGGGQRAGRVGRSAGATDTDRKSVVASGLLSFFFGPVGWIYAAPLREAIPAALVYLAAGSVLSAIMPLAVVSFVAGIVHPVSALLGLGYAWKYNRAGRRAGLLESGTK